MSQKSLWERMEAKIVSTHEESYWTIDENDPVIKKLIAEGKIEFAFKESWSVDDKGRMIKFY